MNKKLLLATMSLAVLAACTTDDFQSQSKKVAEEVSPIKFELVNGNDAVTRASWSDANKAVSFSATDGDLFTLYHGGALAGGPVTLSNLENAIYTAEPGTPATLSTPSMIKAGKAIMVWPVDSNFNIEPAEDFTISIPAEQKDFVNEIPYVSDLIEIGVYNEKAPYNTAGYKRNYPIFMRQMGSLLTLKAEYAGTDKKLKDLEAGEDGIKPIELTDVTLVTGDATKFTKEIPVIFADAGDGTPGTIKNRWNSKVANNAWTHVTTFDVASIMAAGQTNTLSAEKKSLIENNGGAKIIMLPQAAIAEDAPSATDPTGVDAAAVIVNTIYGQVYVAANGVGESKYTVEDAKDAWGRYITDPLTKKDYETATTTKDADGKTLVTSKIAAGMMQTINWFSTRTSSNDIVKNEPVGGLLTRYVKVLLNHLDMTNLHIKDDKQLRDVARVWKELNITPVTVFLDGDENDVFEISQKTITTINEVNKGKAFADWFKVKPCTIADPDENCKTIVITGGGDVQDVAFIADNGGTQVEVEFNEGETWNWKGAVKVEASAVKRFINKGTLENAGDATLETKNNAGNAIDVPLRNNGTWNVNSGTLTVKFTVSNTDNGVVNIKKGAQYRQDKTAAGDATIFYNWANAVPSRFKAIPGNDTKIGKVNNYGVFAAMNTAKINNYGGLIKHADKDAKTFITSNQVGGDFTSQFAAGTNAMGMIELPYDNKDENNISISAAANQGFVAVVVDAETAAAAGIGTELNNKVVGEFVNYIIINGGIETITNLAAKIKYVEIADKTKEIVWKLDPAEPDPYYTGLMVLSDVNITLGTTISATTTYLGENATMYVGGTFNKATTDWAGYYGNTSGNVTTNYVYFGGL